MPTFPLCQILDIQSTYFVEYISTMEKKYTGLGKVNELCVFFNLQIIVSGIIDCSILTFENPVSFTLKIYPESNYYPAHIIAIAS